MYNKQMNRFWNKVKKTDDCWLWTASKTPHGYGRFKYNNEERAHRVSWLITNGDIPKGMQINHKEDICKNKDCVNPEHLYLGTQKENVIDMMKNKNHGMAKKTHCKEGHEFNKENTGFQKKKTQGFQRYCRTCKRNQMRKRTLKVGN